MAADVPDAAVSDPVDGDADPEEAPSPTPTPMPTAAPVENGDFTIDAVIGYDGLTLLYRMTPTFVTVTNNGANFDGLLGVNVFYSQTEYDRYEIPLTLASGATKRVMLPIKPRVRQDMYAFELVKNGAIVAEQRIAPARLVSPETLTIGLLSEGPQALTYMNQRANGLDTLRGEQWLTVPLSADVFPDSSELMGSFNILVVDGFDVRTLSDAQREALATWLLKGGVVIVSGGAKAADGYPFFSTWTGLSAGKLEEAGDITPDLLRYMTITGSPAEEDIWLNALPSGSLVSTGTAGLIAMHTAGNGLIYTAAFDLGGKPVSTWASMTSLWPRVLRQSASTQYQLLLNRLDESMYYDNSSYQAQQLINNLRVGNDESGLPVLLLLAAFLLLIGFGGYLVLKRFDKREWLWAAVPAAAIVFALIMLLMSNTSQMNEPVALTASRVMVEGDSAQYNTYIGVATPNGGEMTIETSADQLPRVITTNDRYYSYYDDGTTDRLFRPVTLRQRMRYGQNPAVGFASNEAWDARTLMVSGLEAEVGGLTANLWMEKDGLHGEVVNNTDYLLEGGMLVTSLGYCFTGDLLPGQRAEISMLTPNTPVDITAANFRYKPGIMYSTFDVVSTASSYSYSESLYTYLRAAVYDGLDYNSYEANPESEQKYSLISLFESDWSFYESTASYYFFAFNDSLGKIAVRLNNQSVTRTAHKAVIGCKAQFEPIGPTGVVLFHQGLIPAEVVFDQGDDLKPRLPTEADGESQGNNVFGTARNYLTLTQPVALRFVLPEYPSYTIEKMTLSSMSYENVPKLYLYNHETDTWDEQLILTVSKDGKGWAPYIDKGGELYVRYVPSESGGRYDSMNLPVITLKGQVNE